jgi:hypothetical protein
MVLRRLLRFLFQSPTSRVLILGFSVILVLSGGVSSVVSQPSRFLGQPLEGQILYSPMWETTTYLVNGDGTVNHTWDSLFAPGVSVWWLGDGTILRTIRLSGAPGGGGGVQIVSWNGSLLWDFRYDSNGVLSHHDVKSLPNGNVLLIAWEHKTRNEAIEAGRNPALVYSGGLSIDHVIEVKPTSPTSGQIVWEWHTWDHLVQDYDASKENYGVVSGHPELVDINYWNTSQGDMMHTNSIDYNAALDQILVSVCYYNEVWVIDHSTTTSEAAGHAGGRSGKGGDILYRWGNPVAYHRGTTADQKLFMQHDATWVKPGCPGEGDILVFNNEVHGHSSVDEITPPINEAGQYFLVENASYGPLSATWSYTAAGFYAGQFCGAIRLNDGNTLITNGESGKVFEVTPLKETIWSYDTGVILFKVVYISPDDHQGSKLTCSGSLSWTDVHPGAVVNGSFEIANVGVSGSLLNWSVNTSTLTWGTWSYMPQSGENLTPEEGSLTVQVSVVAPNASKSDFEGYVRVENLNNPLDFKLVPVVLKTPVSVPRCPILTVLARLLHVLSSHIVTVFEKLMHVLAPY